MARIGFRILDATVKAARVLLRGRPSAGRCHAPGTLDPRNEAVMADANRYPLTTTPIKLGAVEIRNRFYLSPHGVGYNVGYEPSDVFAEYYRVRARTSRAGRSRSSRSG